MEDEYQELKLLREKDQKYGVLREDAFMGSPSHKKQKQRKPSIELQEGMR